jgi:archaeosortase A (PGF-CTERM-specific)
MIWIALGFFIIASIIRGRNKFLIGGVGWILFSVYWSSLISYYFGINDLFNVVLIILISIFCLIIALYMIRERKDDVLLTVTKLAAITCLIYFPLAEIELLNRSIISLTAKITCLSLNLLGIPAELYSSTIQLGNISVGIILACTAIESIAFFTGVIMSVNADLRRKMRAILVSVPVIYILNIIRNVFVVTACGYEWFGSPSHSFYIAHHVLAKIGSTIALLVIAYAVISILPEVLNMIEDIWALFRRRSVQGS